MVMITFAPDCVSSKVFREVIGVAIVFRIGVGLGKAWVWSNVGIRISASVVSWLQEDNYVVVIQLSWICRSNPARLFRDSIQQQSKTITKNPFVPVFFYHSLFISFILYTRPLICNHIYMYSIFITFYVFQVDKIG